MKTTKRLFALLVSLALVLAMSVTSFATGENASIKITNNTSTAKSYTAYKIFDISTNGTSYAYTYTSSNSASDDFLDALKNGITGTTTVDSPFNVESTADANVFNVTFNDSYTTADIVAFLTAAYNAGYMDDLTNYTSGTAAANGGTADITGMDYGYYYITGSTGAAVELYSLASTTALEIEDKEYVPFTKTVSDSYSTAGGSSVNAQQGDTVYFTITGEVPDYRAYASYTYSISDTMDDNLTLIANSISVQTYNATSGYTTLTAGTEYTVTTTGLATGVDFQIDIDVMGTTSGTKLNIGDTIIVTYSATVTGTSGVYDNTATLTYSNNPTTDDKGTLTAEAEVYNASIVIDKVDSTDTSTKLQYATFVLYNTSGQYYKLENGVVSWVTDINDATALETDANGAATFTGLENGTYYLHETIAPSNYNLLLTDTIVTINYTASSTSLSQSVQVQNSTGTEMPETGGMGTTIFYILGAVLVIGAGVLLVVRRRMNSEK